MMKKLNKKYSILVFISIILVIIILTIFITTKILDDNISNIKYESTAANMNSNLIANYIKAGTTIGGVTGIFTSDANATAKDIIKGKTAYVNGNKITGTLEVNDQENNYFVKDRFGNSIKVPAGFKVVNPDDAVTDGIIIEDINAENEYTQGSQFVWIPVGEIITDSNGTKENITLGRYTFSTTGEEQLVQTANDWENTSSMIAIDGVFKELSQSTRGNQTAKNLEDFITKAVTSGGYYIGRYELGDALATSSEHTKSNNPVTCKTGVYPFNYITQTEASNLCRIMYGNNNFESDLVNSYAWDTAIVYIQKFSGDNDYSIQYRLQRTLAKCGEAQSSGNNDVRCNIYDMAGNTLEWTTETRDLDNATQVCVRRGGYYDTTDRYVCYRNYQTILDCNHHISARPILYL